MGSQNRKLRTLTIQFHVTDEELADIHGQLDALVDRLVFEDMGLSGRVINLIRMMRGQVGVASNYITQADYEQSVKDFRLDSSVYRMVRNPRRGKCKNSRNSNTIFIPISWNWTMRSGLLLLGLTAKAHVFLLGPPGTAKSHLAEVLCDALDLKSFRFLFTDETKHKDIFGIQSIQALKEDKDILITEGKLPEAEVAYLDEIWKANASVVNMLLWALRDGKFTNGGQAVKMPLVFAVACSNEIPEDSTRRAIYDRLAHQRRGQRHRNGGKLSERIGPN